MATKKKAAKKAKKGGKAKSKAKSGKSMSRGMKIKPNGELGILGTPITSSGDG
jgi:hypothetical protein